MHITDESQSDGKDSRGWQNSLHISSWKEGTTGALLLQFETEKSCAGARRFRFGKGRLFLIDEKRSKLA